MVRTALGFTLFFAVVGCSRPPAWEDPGPEDVFERFLLEWYMGNSEQAYQRIAPEDREVIERARVELERTLGEKAPQKHELLVGSAISSPYGFQSVERLTALDAAPKAGQRVELGLTYLDGRQGKATLVWGGERWFVDLPLEALVRQAGPSEEDGA